MSRGQVSIAGGRRVILKGRGGGTCTRWLQADQSLKQLASQCDAGNIYLKRGGGLGIIRWMLGIGGGR